MIREDLRVLEREYQAMIDIGGWSDIFARRITDDLKIPKAIELNFEEPKTLDEQRIKKWINEYRLKKTAEHEQELFKQKRRLADAERVLKTKPTKKAANDQRIATNKIEDYLRRIDDVKRTELKERDRRIYPYYYCPIIVQDGKTRKIIPARYLCRPVGKPAHYDTTYPGIFNARRDSLEGFWKGQFGNSHGLWVISSFFENVPLHKAEHRELREGEKEQNIVLHFIPRDTSQLAIACLWSHWTGKGDEPALDSFAAITDEPNAEVAAAGHDRTIVSIEQQNVDSWLSPRDARKESLYALFDNRQRPYFENRKAA